MRHHPTPSPPPPPARLRVAHARSHYASGINAPSMIGNCQGGSTTRRGSDVRPPSASISSGSVGSSATQVGPLKKWTKNDRTTALASRSDVFSSPHVDNITLLPFQMKDDRSNAAPGSQGRCARAWQSVRGPPISKGEGHPTTPPRRVRSQTSSPTVLHPLIKGIYCTNFKGGRPGLLVALQ